MQPLYEDQYGILRLGTGYPSHFSALLLYPLKKIEARLLLGCMLLKKGYLFLKNVFEGYRAYVFRTPKLLSQSACIFGRNPKGTKVD